MNHLSRAAAAVLIGLAFQAQAGTLQADAAEARQFYDEGRWALAWERFAALADRGDVESARMVIRMTRFGPQLFRQAWTPAPARYAQWHIVAAGEPVQTAVKD